MKIPLGSLRSLRLLVPAGFLLLLGCTLALPRPVRMQHVTRPTHRVIIAAIQQGRMEQVTGRILQVESRAVVLRVLLGTKQVTTLRRTTYVDAAGTPLARTRLHRGDLIHARGYSAGDILLAVQMQDTSRH